MIESIIEPAKKIYTKGADGKENGFIVELMKDGRFTTSYLSCCYVGSFKGYHLHKVRKANYVCIRGKLKVTLFTKNGKEEYTLSADDPQRLSIPINTPTGLLNVGAEEAWIVNTPFPAYDPLLVDEQVDYTEKELIALSWPYL